MNFEIRANRSCAIKRRGVRRLRFLNRVTPVSACHSVTPSILPRNARTVVSRRPIISTAYPALLHPQPPRPQSTQYAYTLLLRPSEELTMPTPGAYLSPTCP